MARRTTPRRSSNSNRRLSRQQEVARRRKLAEKSAAEQQTRNEAIAAFHENSHAGAKPATSNDKKTKTGNALKILMWAALILLFAIPTILFGGSMVGEWMGTKKISEFDTAAGGSMKTILPLQPYEVPLNRKTTLQFNSYLELTKAEAATTVCHYMPRYKAAILGVLNVHFSKGDPASVDQKLVISDLQNEIKKSAALKEIRHVHIKASIIDADKKTQVAGTSFQSAQMVACP